MRRSRIQRLLVAAVWMVTTLAPQPLFADTVDNPGPFTVTAGSGYLKVGSQIFEIDPENPPTMTGEVDTEGNMVIPLSGIAFPETVVEVPILGQVTVSIVALGDATGTLNPVTGESVINFSLRVRLMNRLLPAGCGIGPINARLTTVESGFFTGELYNQEAGTATYVENAFGVPRSNGCGLFGGAIDSFAGLPSPAPNNEIQLVVQFDPIFFGS